MKSLLEYFVKSFISWRFRTRSIFYISLATSGPLLALILGVGSLTGSITYGDITLNVLQGDSIEENLLNLVLLILGLVFGLSFVMLVIEFALDRLASRKNKVFVVEARGLRDDDGASLADSIRDGFPKSRIPYILDLRQRLDGKLVTPEALLPKIAAAKEALNQTRSGNGRENTQVAYGGLTSVPLTFLTGVEFDDEGSIAVFDWDRTSEKWRPLDDLDDGLRLSEPDLGKEPLSESVVLAISVSYPIEQSDLSTTFDLPIVRMELGNTSSNCHWSAEKQSKIADQFFEMAKKLSAGGVRHIHLILAAPNSVVFNFGRRYDKRNLPELTVYQFERSQEIKYPWGVRMPVGKTDTASIERISPR